MKKQTADAANRLLYLMPFLLIALGAFLRFYRLGMIPYGLNNDEASIGYDAYALATYGIDRNGYPWPVYPITWGGGGGGPMAVYLCVLTEKLFGHGVFFLRLPSAILGTLTLPLFYLLLKKTFDDRTALAGLLLLALNPWHLLMSRFTLDCNTLAFWLAGALLFFILGAGSRKTVYFFLSAVLFALCLYVYGSATLVIPVFLLLTARYAVKHSLMSIRQLLVSVLCFLAVLSPLLIFYAVNFLDLPAIVTALFSIPRFVTSRSVFYAFDRDLPRHMGESLLYLVRFLTIGPKDTEVVCNQVPGFGVFYRYTFPLTVWGIVSAVTFLRNRKILPGAQADPELQALLIRATLILFTCTTVFSLFLRLEISRMTLFLLPVLTLQAVGIRDITERFGNRAYVLLFAGICAGAMFFTRSYFGERYHRVADDHFMAGYGEAVLYAEECRSERPEETMIYSTYSHVAAPFAVALYYTKTPVQDFIDTAVYKVSGDAQIATAFTHFVFGLPEDIETEQYAQDILILHEEDLSRFSARDYTFTPFEKFSVAVRNGSF